MMSQEVAPCSKSPALEEDIDSGFFKRHPKCSAPHSLSLETTSSTNATQIHPEAQQEPAPQTQRRYEQRKEGAKSVAVDPYSN